MDIEKLALDTNEEIGNEINSVLSEENKLSPRNVNTKGFLLDESDILLFQKELNAKEESNNTSVLSENKNLLSEKLKKPLYNRESFQKFLSKKGEKSLYSKETTSKLLPQKGDKMLRNEENTTGFLSKKGEKPLYGNKNELKMNAPIGKEITQGKPNSKDVLSKVLTKGKEQSSIIPETRKHNDKELFHPLESSVETFESSAENMIKNVSASSEHLSIEPKDKSLNITNKTTPSGALETNDTSYEIKSMPLEISVEPNKGITAESAKFQTSSKIENVVRTHSEIISQQIKDQIIDRILVSTNDLELNKTVKIVIHPSLLENTQVNFQKIGQNLSIQFETINTNSLQFLKANQIDLQLYLQENLKQFQDVSVRIKGSSQSFEQPQDGRSRNRYEYEKLDDEEQ